MPTTFHQKPNLFIQNVTLKVSNLSRSIDFYTEIIGFRVLQQEEGRVTLTADGQHALITLVEVPNAQFVRGATGLYHFALLLPSRKDLGNLIQHFIQKNVQIGAGDHDVSEALYLSDPDGNGIEMYIDRPADTWKWDSNGQVYMTTDPVQFQSVLREADGTWSGLPTDTVMGHIHLSVRNLQESEDFYTSLLDYAVVSRYGGQALFISTGGYHHHIGLNTWHSEGADALPKDAVGIQSYTVQLPDQDYAVQLKKRFVEQNMEIKEQENIFSIIEPNGIEAKFTI
ncbi:VOC family protein [Kurthia gibsonii]|uniref:VOC family protein n=1 Tax=Kurthia gibsonii TaxID=33946 RepID=UPI001144828B|nr:VOC family protein [Kurthia gibsonii]GED20957.1 catechol-2,3-dioxygenase [Kurthia gibsonii]